MLRTRSTPVLLENPETTKPAFSRTALRWFLAVSKGVSVTYALTKSAGLSLVDNGFFIGGTAIDLASDKLSNTEFKSVSAYSCTAIGNNLSVELQANGFTGDNWSLSILVDGKQLDDFPITERVDSKGHADHDQDHLFTT